MDTTSTNKRRYLWLTMLSLLVVSLCLLLFYGEKSKLAAAAIASREAATAGPNHQHDQAHDQAADHQAAGMKAHSHEIPEGLDFSNEDDFRQQQHWYEPAQLDASGKYLPRATPMQLDASCAGRKELAHRTLESAIQAELGLVLNEVTPDDVLVEEIAQFWQRDGMYFQISGRWDKDMPASYEINHFRSRSADFSIGVEHLPLPQLPDGTTPSGSIDVISLGRYISDVIAQEQKLGAIPGSRLVHLLPSGADETLDLKLNNGRVVSWMFGNGRCQLRTTGDAYCRCVADPTLSNSQNKEPYRVTD